MPSKKLWAIGFKDWVEIRSSPSPPRIEASEVVKIVKEEVTIYPTYEEVAKYYLAIDKGVKPRPAVPKNRVEIVDREIKLNNVIYIGGRVVGGMKPYKFRQLTGFTVGKGKKRRLSNIVIEKLVNGGFNKFSKYKGVEDGREVEEVV